MSSRCTRRRGAAAAARSPRGPPAGCRASRAPTSTSARRPSAASRRTTSPTKSGLPSVSAWIVAASSAAAPSPARQLDVARDVGRGQAAEVDPAGHRLARQLGEGRQRAGRARSGRRRGRCRRRGSGCRRAHPRRIAATAATARRRRAGRRGRSRADARRPRSAGSGPPSRRAGSGRPRPRAGRLRQVGEELAQLGHDLGEVRGAGRELRAQRLRVALLDVARAATAPTASRPGRRPPPSSGRRARGRRAPARGAITSSARRLLPMPGSPTSRNKPARPATRGLEAGEQLVELGLAPDEDAAGSAPRPPAPGAPTDEVERGVLPQDRLLELAQLRPGSIPSSSTSRRVVLPGRPPSASAWRPER